MTKVSPIEEAALRYLYERGPQVAGFVGARLWPSRAGRGCSVNGGGDYAAQMLLGRLRKKDLVQQHVPSPGATIWELSTRGRAWVEGTPAPGSAAPRLYEQVETGAPAPRLAGQMVAFAAAGHAARSKKRS